MDYIVLIVAWIIIFTAVIRRHRKIRSLPKEEQRRLQKELEKEWEEWEEWEWVDKLRKESWDINPDNASLTNPWPWHTSDEEVHSWD